MARRAVNRVHTHAPRKQPASRAEIERLTRALRATPHDAGAAVALGEALMVSGMREAAARAFRHALSLDADFFSAHLGLGALHAAAGDAPGALAACIAAHRLAPADARVRDGIAAAFAALGCRLAAAAYRDGTTGDDARDAATLIDRAHGLAQARLYDEAEATLGLLDAPDRDRPDVLFVRANLLAARDERDDAAALYRRVVAEAPQMAEAWANLGGTLAVLGAIEEAEAALRRALALQPDLKEAGQNLANVQIEAQRDDEALATLRALLARWPDRPELHNNLANLLLLLGRFEEGWDAYEWRRLMPGGAAPALGMPEWRGEPLRGRTLHVIGEQGPGDVVMFATCLEELATLDGPVHLHCEARLVPLFARSFRFASITATLPERQTDGVAILIGSLPRLFRRDADAFRRNRPFLVPDAELVEHWRARFAALGGVLRVGISWRGGKDPVNRRQRTMALEDWLPILTLPGVVAVDLQYGPHDDEVAQVAGKHGVAPHRFHADVDPKANLDGLVAQVAALDLLVSIDNSTVHVAGAAGTPTLALTPHAPSWRWQRERDDCLWYPSVRLIRQTDGEPWSAVLRRAASEVETIAAARSTGAGRQDLPGAARPDPASSAGSMVNAAPREGDAGVPRPRISLVSEADGTRLAT